MDRYDTIIVGAGHNGLICAAYLARHGQRVLLVEAADAAGGLASTREFHPGFHVAAAHTVYQFSPQIAKELELAKHGYADSGKPLSTIGLDPEGNHVAITAEGVSGVDAEDADRYRRYRAELETFRDALAPFWMKRMPGIGGNSAQELLTFAQLGLRLRRLGREDMLEFFRVATLPMRDLLDENFANDRLKAALSWDGIIGGRLAPRSPNQSVLMLLYRLCGEHGGQHVVPQAGIRGLIDALVAAATGAGAQLRLGAAVKQILVEGDESGLRATGVELASGERIAADRVVSSADPQRTFLELVGTRHLEIGFSNRIRRLRCEGYVAKLHLALAEEPRFRGLEQADGRMIIAPDLDAIEFAFDDAKYGQCSSDPVMEIVIPSLREPALAPPGQHLLSAHVMYVPARLKGGWTADAREALTSRLLDELERYAPGLRKLVLHAELLTPADLETLHGVTGGHWHHTEFAIDQLLMMRPTYEAAQYATPIPGLFLCGAGSHPGGGLSGAPGHNAARVILS
ncbi:NAD(P)/FAD-dependent oxidoreductase [Haliea sp. E1-2-M8]|uniref:phytoene desaturase family protein n=1 Tax=Haliea sp. E1-2-M8 TaxID=3064706 RepID=UPI00271EFA2E|nr:NAD(P)/FAD-dependent oxidoreductase [Haliea sp. E1-2-M8]MDO8860137.1 NAD(P)/FAD-dependent oxidoreductase [Haliea sp. E1-2-M8]